jgi:hypothetical protein
MPSTTTSGLRCAVPRSERNPFKARCVLPAAHTGDHQWGPEPQARFADTPSRELARVAASGRMVDE